MDGASACAITFLFIYHIEEKSTMKALALLRRAKPPNMRVFLATLMLIGATSSFVVSPDKGSSNGAYSLLEPVLLQEASACEQKICESVSNCTWVGAPLKCVIVGGNYCIDTVEC